MKKFLLLIVIFIVLPSLVNASEIILKSGQKIDGKIIEQTNKFIKIDTGVGMAITYYSDEIDTVDGRNLQDHQSPNSVSTSEVILKSGQKVYGKIVEQTDKYIKIDPGIGMVMTYYADEVDLINEHKMRFAPPPAIVVVPFDHPTVVMAQLPIPKIEKPTQAPATSEANNGQTIQQALNPSTVKDNINNDLNIKSEKAISNPQTQEQADEDKEFTITRGDSIFNFDVLSNDPIDLRIYGNNPIPFGNYENMGQLSLSTRGFIAVPIDVSNKVWSQYHCEKNAVDQSYILQVIPSDDSVAKKIDDTIGPKGGCARVFGKNLSFKEWLYKGNPRKTTYSIGQVPFKLDRDKFLYVTDITSFTCGSSTENLPTIAVKEKTIFEKMAFLVSLGIGGILLIVIPIIIFGIFPTYCLQRISEKSNRGVPWMAWVPIANFFLMCTIADVPYKSLWFLLLGFMPFVGIFCIYGYFIFIGYKMAQSLNKSIWWGMLTAIPLINVIAYGVLAFS